MTDPLLLRGISHEWVAAGQALLVVVFAAWFLLIAAKRLRDLELPDYLSILVTYGSSQIAGGFEPPISNAILIALQGGSLLLLLTIPGSCREEPSGD